MRCGTAFVSAGNGKACCPGCMSPRLEGRGRCNCRWPPCCTRAMAASSPVRRPCSTTTSETVARAVEAGPATELIDVLVPAARQRRDAAFVRIHRTIRMPERCWQAGPLRIAPPARAVADTARGLASLGTSGWSSPTPSRKAAAGSGNCTRNSSPAQTSDRPCSARPDGRCRRHQVHGGSGPQGPAHQVQAPDAAVQPEPVRRRVPSSPSPTHGGPSSALRWRSIQSSGTLAGGSREYARPGDGEWACTR